MAGWLSNAVQSNGPDSPHGQDLEEPLVTTNYLLPCSCGKTVAVRDTQSGQTVRCQCGAELEVPTRQRLHELEQAPVEGPPAATRPGWNPAWGIVLLGVLVMIAGGVFTYFTYQNRPILSDVNQITPWESFLMWQSLRTGVRLPELAEVPYLEAKRFYHQKLGIGLAIIAVGGLIAAISAVVGWTAGARAARRRTT